MTLPTTLPTILEALRSAGATEEMLAAAIAADRGARAPHRAKDAERKRRARAAKGGAHPGRRPADAVARPADIAPRPSDTEPCSADAPADERMRARLLEAAQHHAEPLADVGPMRRLIDQGCDLKADILPTVARTYRRSRVPSSVGGAMAREGNPGVARAAAPSVRRQSEGRRGAPRLIASSARTRLWDAALCPLDAPLRPLDAGQDGPRLWLLGRRGGLGSWRRPILQPEVIEA